LGGVPVASGKIQSIFFGLIVGLGFGGVLAFLAEYFDKRFQTVEDAEQYMGLPFLGFIPHYRLAKQRVPQLITLQEPWTVASEAYRTLRTWIQLLQRPVQTILITSAVAGEGKSTTAANLAISFAQLGRRVLLVDADLRRPTLHSLFNIEDRSEGLTDVLVLGSDWKATIRNSPMENLKILLVGRRPLNPTELLSTMRMQQLLETWRQYFDIIIFDSPVILTIPDTAILAPKMDGVILVHNQYRSNREIALGAKKLLERVGANVLGMVFNNIDAKEGRYYSGTTYSLNRYEEKNHHDNFIDMRPSETDKEWKINSDVSPSSDIYQLAIIEKTARSIDCIVTIHNAFLQKKISGYDARSGSVFLVIDLELYNASSFPQVIDPLKTAVIILDNQESIYGNALRSVVSIKGVNEEESHQFSTMQHFPFDPVLTQVVSGLSKQIEIKENSTVRGVIIYQVSDVGDKYLFEYNGHDIKILINLIRQ
jgi:capsular exopolysaccharide synthesis family protein